MAFTECYKNNYIKFDWFLMLDMDEFLYIVNDTLKSYLTKKIFDKCDFIKIHSVVTTDNDLIYYDKRPLFQRFKPPYINSTQIKSIIRGNIPNLKYWVHSPYISPNRNITCNSEGERIYYKDMNFQHLYPIKINKAYIIHFTYKTAEELMNKLKRIYIRANKTRANFLILFHLINFFNINKMTIEKIKFISNKINITF